MRYGMVAANWKNDSHGCTLYYCDDCNYNLCELWQNHCHGDWEVLSTKEFKYLESRNFIERHNEKMKRNYALFYEYVNLDL